MRLLHSRYRPLAIAILIIVAVFGIYEIVERNFLANADPVLLHWLHIARGAGTSILVALVLVVPLVRGMRVPLSRSLPVHFNSAHEAKDLRGETLWVIRLRWLASIGIAIYAAFGLALKLFPATPPAALVATAAALPLANLVFRMWKRVSLQIQIVFDLLLLSVLIHYTGGLQNPLVFIATFHVIIAGILLSKREAYVTALLALILLSTLGIREAIGLLPRYPIAGIPMTASHPILVAGVTAALGVALLGTAYFTTAIMEILRRRESELAQAGKMAAVGELAGSVAHEINNPLAIISAKVEGLLELNGQMPERAAHDLTKVSKHVNRIATITRGLLSYSRPSYGRKEPVELPPILAESLELFRSRAKSQDVRIDYAPAPGLPRFKGNANEMSQVVLNLANNALDVMPRGGALGIRAGREQDWIWFEVSDTGTGIAPEAQERLFEPFFTTKTEGGTGLGLAICHGLVRSHGGRIDVESAPGAGSTFRVFLPALQETAP